MSCNFELNLIKKIQNYFGNNQNMITKIMQGISIPFHGKVYTFIIIFLYLVNKITVNQLMIIFISQPIIFTIKYFVKRKRPYTENKDIKMLEYMNFDNYSFPSGHTLNALLLSIFLEKNKIINLSYLPYIVGFSRIYLGVHYLTDIVGSFILVKIILSIFYKLQFSP